MLILLQLVEMVKVFVGIGSNLGNRGQNICRAVAELEKLFKIVEISSVFETEPWGKVEGKWFYNCIAVIETKLMPQKVLEKLQEIEKAFGRKKKPKSLNWNARKKFSARAIDLDIIFYGSKIVNDKNLVIPHHEAHNRKFVLMPLCEIAPNFCHPVLKRTSIELLGLLDLAKGKNRTVSGAKSRDCIEFALVSRKRFSIKLLCNAGKNAKTA